MWTIKEVANNLQISTQAIYKQRQELIDKGFMIKSDRGILEITDNGFNYLRDKKITYMQQHTNQPIQPVVNNTDKEEVEQKKEKGETIDISSSDKVVNLLINQLKEQLQTVTNQLQEMTEQRDYFKLKFEEKDNLCNQYMNSHLLPPLKEDAEETPTEAPKKQSLFKRLFGN